ncbi:MAG: hypothetical protein JWO36_1333 [Myxococcales bacterium]|nr:hypothetical protein [Myxococcales bacterium]
MRIFSILALFTACSYHHGLGGDAGSNGSDAAPIDASNGDVLVTPDTKPACDWAVHFDGCAHASFPTTGMTISGAATLTTNGGGMFGGSGVSGGTTYVKSDITQRDGTHALLVLVHSLDMSGTLVIVGDKPVIFASETTIATNTLIDASSAQGGNTGPGADLVACTANAAAPGVGTSSDGGGGGGGGFATVGGSGGTANQDVGGAGGTALAAIPAAIRGGCPGAKGSKGSGSGAAGGNGGKAGGGIELAAKQSIMFAASITTGGAGGDKGNQAAGGGGGGGTGGVISFDSPSITFAGGSVIAANGGGGGGGGNAGFTQAGQNGVASGSRANGGIGAQTGGRGGALATGAASDRDGEALGASSAGGGGGGGGVGYILVHGTVVNLGALISPPSTPI